MPFRVAIADDDEPYRSAIVELLALEPQFEVVGSYPDAISLLSAAKRESVGAAWEIVLMDIEMPGRDGISAASELKSRFPDLHVVMLTAFEEPERIVRAIVSGADGYLVKRADARELLEEVRAVAVGGSPLTPSVARSVLSAIRSGALLPSDDQHGSKYELTERETEVLRSLVAGKGYKEIAYDLRISVDTVRSHIRRIYRKLQVHSAPEAVARAIRERIV